MPVGSTEQFRPERRRVVLPQCHRARVTLPRLTGQLRAIGTAIVVVKLTAP
jgi:hypothetical protein